MASAHRFGAFAGIVSVSVTVAVSVSVSGPVALCVQVSVSVSVSMSVSVFVFVSVSVSVSVSRLPCMPQTMTFSAIALTPLQSTLVALSAFHCAVMSGSHLVLSCSD